MAYCLKCKAKLEDDDIVCPFCGGETGGVSRLKQLSDEIQVDVGTVIHTGDEADQMDPYDVRGGKTAAVFAYLGPLLLIPLFTGKESDFRRFHANQGLLLLIFGALSFLSTEIAGWLFSMIPLFGEVIAALLLAVWCLVFLSGILWGILSAAGGKAKPLPIIGKLRILS